MFTEVRRAGHYLKHFFSSHRKGHGVHSPFAYQLCEEVFYNPHKYYDFEVLDRARKMLLADKQVLEIRDLGAGSKVLANKSRKVCDIAARGMSSQRQSEILYKLVNFLGCKNSVELGTSLGLNALYLAKANPKGKVISIEGSPMLADYASALAVKLKAENLQVIKGSFNEKLPEIIKVIPSLDFIYIDGNHTKAATLESFNAALKKKHPGSVFVFDDIYWSPGMTSAWREITSSPEVRLSIDTFHSGYVFFNEEIREKVHFRFRL